MFMFKYSVRDRRIYMGVGFIVGVLSERHESVTIWDDKETREVSGDVGHTAGYRSEKI